MRILIVEDEPSIFNFLKEGLEEEGFFVDVAENGKTGLKMALDFLDDYDIIILDWMLPGMGGIEICRNIRKQSPLPPIIFLTARDTPDDAVFALECGANDYIRKPFSFDELLARIRVLLRGNGGGHSVFSNGQIVLDTDSHQVTKEGTKIALTQKEFALLEFLLRNKGKVSRRTRIIEKVWDIHFDYDTSVIDVYINALRKKLDDKNKPSFIETIRGVGYRINEDV